MAEAPRYIPDDVRRQLRQEAYFGCASCGNPILTYHHIIPWAEHKHNCPEHMVALCATCHAKFGKLKRSKSYEIKQNPRNRLVGMIRGELGTNVTITKFLVGSNTFTDTPTILSYFGQPILQYRVIDGEVFVSVYLPKPDGWPDILIRNNDLLVNLEGKWDIEFKTNFLNVQKDFGTTYFKIDIKNEVAEISARLDILGTPIELLPSKTVVGSSQFTGAELTDLDEGIAIGDHKSRILWPNFTMSRPSIFWATL